VINPTLWAGYGRLRGRFTIIDKEIIMTTTDAPLYGDKTLSEWDRKWEPVPNWQKDYQDDLKYRVGLYRFLENGRILLIGVGTAEHGALAKRISDYRRPSPSGRRCHSGQYIYENRHRLQVEVMVVGDVNNEQAAITARELKPLMIERHKPELNVPADVIAQKIQCLKSSHIASQPSYP